MKTLLLSLLLLLGSLVYSQRHEFYEIAVFPNFNKSEYALIKDSGALLITPERLIIWQSDTTIAIEIYTPLESIVKPTMTFKSYSGRQVNKSLKIVYTYNFNKLTTVGLLDIHGRLVIFMIKQKNYL
jgi:hypothetical protein